MGKYLITLRVHNFLKFKLKYSNIYSYETLSVCIISHVEDNKYEFITFQIIHACKKSVLINKFFIILSFQYFHRVRQYSDDIHIAIHIY